MGMLFDHGLDATTAVVVMYPLGWMTQQGPGLPTLIIVMLSTIPFYFFTLQEYYLGRLVLANLSGPDDTSLVFSMVCFTLAYFGTDIFLPEIDFLGFGNMRLGHAILSLVISFEICSSIHCFSSELYHARNESTF